MKEVKKQSRIATRMELLYDSLDLIRRLEKELELTKDYRKTPEQIIKTVSEELGVSIANIKAGSRKNDYVEARHMAMCLMREFTALPLTDIGKHFNRDHASVIHGVKRTEERMSVEPRFRQKYNYVRTALQ